MKRIFLLLACACMLAACGGGVKDDSQQPVSPELQKVQKSSDDVKAKSDELNKKADSLLNNI